MSLGSHIAPDYEHQTASSTSLSSSSPSSSRGTGDRMVDLEKQKTAPDDERPTRPDAPRQPPPQAPVGFWHYEMSGVRLHVIKSWFKMNLILAVAILGFLSLFWGAIFKQDQRVSSLSVWVVDFDGQVEPYRNMDPLVGPSVVRVVRNLLDAPGPHLDYVFRSPADFSNDPMNVRKGIYDFHAWAAVIINANATALLRNAVTSANSSYDPLGSCQIIYNTARDQTTTQSNIVPSLTRLQKVAVTEFGRQWIPSLLKNSSITTSDLQAVPQAVAPAIEFTTFDLRPFGPPVATPAVSIGLIYLIIISFFSFTFFLPIHMRYLSPKGHPPLHFHHLIVWRYMATVVSYMLLSLVYSAVSLAFLLPMNNRSASHVSPAANPNAYHRGTFVVYWMINWVGMTAFGLASENMAMILGMPWVALWLIFWVISNVATGFYAIPLENVFYRWGYAWPMHNIVEATRSTLFDLHPRIGLNFGVLLAWCAIGTALFPLCCYFMRWKGARERRLAAEKEAAWQAKMDQERERPGLFSRVTTLSGHPSRHPSRQGEV